MSDPHGNLEVEDFRDVLEAFRSKYTELAGGTTPSYGFSELLGVLAACYAVSEGVDPGKLANTAHITMSLIIHEHRTSHN